MPFNLFEDQQEFVTGLRRSGPRGNRAIAKETGAKFYMPAKPCKRCNGWLRRTDSGSCQYCATARRKRVYWEDKAANDGRAKFCSVCDTDTDRFPSNGNCKPCHKSLADKHYQENRDRRMREFRERHYENREEENKKKRQYYRANKEKLAAYHSEYRENNKERIRQYRKLPSSMAAHRERQRSILAAPEGKAASHMRNSIHRLLRNKSGSASCEIVGYSARDLVRHIESQFLDGMTWDNYGEWHIDHKRPVSWFIADGITDPAIVNALSNLQPLWAADNIRKLNHYEGN